MVQRAQQLARPARPITYIQQLDSGRCELYLCVSQLPCVRIPLSRACEQPEPSAWRALLAANQMELNFHMASCWFAHVGMAAVHRVLCSGFCRME